MKLLGRIAFSIFAGLLAVLAVVVCLLGIYGLLILTSPLGDIGVFVAAGIAVFFIIALFAFLEFK
ncbi:hypothetical protein [Enterococcus phage IMEEF1]|uniref:Uncharacterized protein n=1 Tax=Enterococcus phage IMEEF1 TaxID=1351735 RepID=S5MRL3_9CAUD|nr:hypothetical protein FDH83_gp57 [Enterococcus phage IMEEF1]AGR49040.1 hypothetical protein [Enterococcus phage IMEEF1]